MKNLVIILCLLIFNSSAFSDSTNNLVTDKHKDNEWVVSYITKKSIHASVNGQVTHGDGLGGASVNYGFPAASDEEYLKAVCKEMSRAKVSALLLPGIGTVEHLHMAVDCGVSTIRVATHCTEADVSEQHIKEATKIQDLDTVGFLMMEHTISAEDLVMQLKLLEAFGANCVYITDSAGYMLPDDVSERVQLARTELCPETEIGFHGHHNLAMGIANSLAAVEAGASRIDGSLAVGAEQGRITLSSNGFFDGRIFDPDEVEAYVAGQR